MISFLLLWIQNVQDHLSNRHIIISCEFIYLGFFRSVIIPHRFTHRCCILYTCFAVVCLKQKIEKNKNLKPWGINTPPGLLELFCVFLFFFCQRDLCCYQSGACLRLLNLKSYCYFQDISINSDDVQAVG